MPVTGTGGTDDATRMTTLDRYIFRGLLLNYLIALAVMISLYVVLDMLFNMDEFTETGGGMLILLTKLWSYYSARVFEYFSQLSGVISLFACLLTVARMRRLNELTAVIASGVSLYRVAVPVLAFGLITTGLWYIDTEIVIPHIAHKLARRHDDALGKRSYGVWFLADRDNALLSAREYDPSERELKRLLVIRRHADGTLDSIIQADLANWQPTPGGSARGRWVLERGVERRRGTEDENAVSLGEDMPFEDLRYYDSDLDPRSVELRQATGWVRYLSTARMLELRSQNLDIDTRRRIAQTRHARFTTPLVSLLMLCLGLPFVLDRMPGNVLADGTKALLTCGACFLMAFVMQNRAPTDAATSALPAWLTILVFTPVAAVLMDRLRT